MPELTDLEKKVITIAKESFINKGIINTEMKDLAAKAGISRSSLYRHFPSSLDIAFHVLNDVLLELMTVDCEIPDTLNGFEQFSFYIHKSVDKLCDNLPMVRFIREFDTLYDLKNENSKAPENFYKTLHDYSRYSILNYFHNGIIDGSIKPCKSEIDTVLTFYWVAQSMTEHIMLRKETYQFEHGAAKAYVVHAVDLMLSGIKA